MNLHLEDKLVLITGSTSGIGFGMAKIFAEEGARVILHGYEDDCLQKAVAAMEEMGKPFYVAAGDIGTAEGADKVIEQVRKIGEPDILVNNAGSYHGMDFETGTDEDWYEMYNSNVMSGVRMTRYFLPRMIRRNQGRVLFISSMSAVIPDQTMLPYCAAKTMVMGIGRGCAEMTKGTRVTVNTVMPGPTWTEGTAKHQSQRAERENKPLEQIVREYFEEFEPTSLLQRFAQVEELARTCVYLCSDCANFVNGASVRVDGGMVRYI